MLYLRGALEIAKLREILYAGELERRRAGHRPHDGNTVELHVVSHTTQRPLAAAVAKSAGARKRGEFVLSSVLAGSRERCVELPLLLELALTYCVENRLDIPGFQKIA